MNNAENKVACLSTTLSLVDLDSRLLGNVCDKMFESVISDRCGSIALRDDYAHVCKIAVVSRQFNRILNECCTYYKTDDVFAAVEACQTGYDLEDVLLSANEKAMARMDIALMAVQRFPLMLEHFSKVIRDNYMVAMAAVLARPAYEARYIVSQLLLDCCNSPAKESKDLAMLCLRLDKGSLDCFSDAVQNDPDVLEIYNS